VLPVVYRGTRAQITNATLLRSYLWDSVRRIRLTRNMRAQLDTWFSDYLLRIGNGTEETFAEDYVKLPDDIIIKWGSPEPIGKRKGSIIHHIDRLIERVFPQLETYCISPVYM